MKTASKRILIIATVVKTHVMQFHVPVLKMFKELGWETVVASRNDYADPSECKIPYCDEFYNIPFERSPIKKDNLVSYRRLKELIDNGNFSIIHCHTPVGGILGRLAARSARKNGTQVVYTAHGFHFYKGAPLKNWLLYYPAEKLCSYFTDTLITINREDFVLAKKHMDTADIRLLPGVGVDTDKFNPAVLSDSERQELRRQLGLSDEDKMVLTVGEMIPRKNYETAFTALSQIGDKHIHYFICGHGMLFSELNQLTHQLGIAENVHFLGYRKDIARICCCTDVFVLSSLQEGLPVALLEAMACCAPIVASNIRGITDLIDDGKNGFLCDATNASQFAEKISLLLRQPDLQKSFCDCSRRKIQAFGLQHVLNEMKKIYCIEGNANTDTGGGSLF